MAQLLASSPWTFAKTAAETNPHHYSARKGWADGAVFDDVVRFIRRCGFRQQYGAYTELALEVNEYFYWTGGLPVSDTGWINRKPLLTAAEPLVDQRIRLRARACSTCRSCQTGGPTCRPRSPTIGISVQASRSLATRTSRHDCRGSGKRARPGGR